jgi:hypothetical protein
MHKLTFEQFTRDVDLVTTLYTQEELNESPGFGSCRSYHELCMRAARARNVYGDEWFQELQRDDRWDHITKLYNISLTNV